MHDSSLHKRLFFAFEVDAPWPAEMPRGRMLQEGERHLTVAFLGNSDYGQLEPLLKGIPLPPFKVGLAGEFDNIVFLPQGHPRVAAYHVSWMDQSSALADYSRILIDWLKSHGFNPDDRKEFLPHVTLCRAPFDSHAWREAFQPLPAVIKNLHLYESMGQLRCRPLWTYPLQIPFEEIEHTADIAFRIRGETTSQIFSHALTALAFKSPEMIKFKQGSTCSSIHTIDDIVIELNRIISRTDAAVGCSFKAVSFHGKIEKGPSGTLTWEMIVDV